MTPLRAAAGALVLVAFLSIGYSSSLNGAMVLDDRVHIQSDALKVRSLSLESFRKILMDARGLDRPVANLSFGMNYYLFGPSLKAYHAVNLLLHAGNAILLFLLARLVFGLSMPDPEASGVGAAAVLLWAVHPIHPNTVTYLVQRMTLLGALFLLLAVLSGAIAWDRRRSRAGWLAAAAAFAVLGILSKQIAITAPMFIALLYVASGKAEVGTGWWKAFLWGVTGTVLLAGAYEAYSWAVTGLDPAEHAASVAGTYRMYSFSLWERIMSQWRIVWFYVGLIFWPLPERFVLEHDIVPSVSLLSPATTLLSFIGILGLLVFAVLVWRRWRPLSFLVFWFLGNLALESSFLPLDMIFEHRTYLPSFGVVGALVYVSHLLSRSSRWGRWVCIVTVLVVAALLSAGTRKVNATFASERTLWENVVRKSPGSGRGWFSLGWIDYFEGRVAESERKLREAVRLSPTGVHERVMLGNVLAERGKREEALRMYLDALRLAPKEPAIHYNLAILYEESGNRFEAVRYRESWARLSGGREPLPMEMPFGGLE